MKAVMWKTSYGRITHVFTSIDVFGVAQSTVTDLNFGHINILDLIIVFKHFICIAVICMLNIAVYIIYVIVLQHCALFTGVLFK